MYNTAVISPPQHVGPPQMQPTIPSSPYTENYQQSSAYSYSRDYGAPPTYHPVPQQNDVQPGRFVPSPPIPAPMVIIP